jgi:hypothetical protein
MMGGAGARLRGIDEIMEEASRALGETRYFEAADLCEKALRRALSAREYERMARICLPLQEARRQIRVAACDTGRVVRIGEIPRARARLEAGCYLVEPPLVGVEANTVRDLLWRRRVAAMVLAREPRTSSGEWPVVAVGGGQRLPVVMRARVPEPPGGVPDVVWMVAAHEALGDAGIAQVQAAWPADHRVEDLIERLEGLPDHEKLMQALEAACRDASRLSCPSPARRRPVVMDERGF